MPNEHVSRRRRAPSGVWTATTYFAEGFPYNIVHKLAEILFADMGASLAAIGLTSLFHLPLNFKFLWASWADTYGNKKQWLIGAELALAGAVAALALATGSSSLTTLSVLFVGIALLMATHDIAIDGYYLEALDERAQARWVGLKAPAYRAALLLVGGPLLSLTGVIGWSWVFALCALALVGLSGFHFVALPGVRAQRLSFRAFWLGMPGATIALVLVGFVVALRVSLSRSSSDLQLPDGFDVGWASLGLVAVLLGVGLVAASGKLRSLDSDFTRGLAAFMGQPRVGVILAFMVTFRLGESFLEKMRYVFLAEHGMTKAFYGIAQGTVGMSAALVAPLIGGFLISRHGLRAWIWPFVLAQNGLNLLYFGLAMAAGESDLSRLTMGSVIVVEMFGAGLGTAVFMVFIMRCCMAEHRAAHMALLTSVMSIGYTLSGTVSGFIAEAWGFQNYFLFTFIATIPNMVLIFFLPKLRQT